MTTERSHGKARTTLPRSSDLRVVEADPDRAGNRLEGGRFAPGNSVGRGRGWKRAIAKLIGRGASDPATAIVAEDGWRDYCASLRELPSDGPNVRGLAALKAHHVAAAAFWSAQSFELGLTTTAGKEADDRALKHGVRAERLVVTMLDVSTKLAIVERQTRPQRAPWLSYEAPEEPAIADKVMPQDRREGIDASTDTSESTDAAEVNVEPSGGEGAR